MHNAKDTFELSSFLHIAGIHKCLRYKWDEEKENITAEERKTMFNQQISMKCRNAIFLKLADLIRSFSSVVLPLRLVLFCKCLCLHYLCIIVALIFRDCSLPIVYLNSLPLHILLRLQNILSFNYEIAYLYQTTLLMTKIRVCAAFQAILFTPDDHDSWRWFHHDGFCFILHERVVSTVQHSCFEW